MTDLFNIQDFQKGANLRTPQQTQSKAPIFNATDNKIQGLANTQTAPAPTIRSKQKMFEDMAIVQKKEGVTDVEALALVKNYYTEKGYTVEGMELGQAPAPDATVPGAFEDNRTFLSRIEEKARENVEIEGEIDTSNRNVFRKFMDRTANDARAFSGLVEVLIGEGFETIGQLVSLITPDIIEKPFKDEVQRQFEMVIGSDVAQTIGTTAKGIGYTAKEVFEMLPEEVQQDVENLGVIGIGLLDLVGSGYIAKQGVVQGAKGAVYLGNKTIKTKNYLFPQESLNDLIAKASQAKTAPDLKAFKDSISLIDTTKMNTYNDLGKSFSKKIGAMSTKVDDMLSTKPVYNIEDLTTTVGKRQTNYVNSAIDDLKKVGAKENDLEFLAKVDDLEDIVKWSEKDINDLARFYGTKFKNKSFSKTTGEPLSSVSASRFENNRAGLKNLVRDKNGNSALKEMDLQISELYTAKGLVDDMGKKVQNLFNKTITRGPLAGLGAGTVRLANTLSGGSIGGALSALGVQSNIGKKTLDVLSIQKNLNKTLKQIDRMESMLDGGKLSNANKAYIERFFADINSRAMGVLPKETPKVKPKVNPAEQAFKDEVGFKKADVSPSKQGFINPQAIADDIAKIGKKATPTQINNLAKKITVGLNLAKEEIKAVYKIVREWLEKQWTKAKPKMAELMDELADKVPGTRAKLFASPSETQKRFGVNMEKLGKTKNEIWKDLGIERGADGKWRFEINDSKAILNKTIIKKLENSDSVYTTPGELLDHKILYKKYPEIKDIDIRIKYDKKATSTTGSFTPYQNRSAEGLVDIYPEIQITTNSIKNLNEIKSTLLHEIQHNIQSIEKFASGGSPAIGAEHLRTIRIGLLKERGKLAKELENYSNTKAYQTYQTKLNEQNRLWTKEGEKILDKLEAQQDALLLKHGRSATKTKEYKDIGKQIDDLFVEYQNKFKLDETVIRKIENIKREIKSLDTQVKNNSGGMFSEKSFETYQKLAGEVEARNVQSRLKLKLEDRKRTRPELTEDIARKDQLIADDFGVKMESTTQPIKEVKLTPDEIKKYKTADDYAKAQFKARGAYKDQHTAPGFDDTSVSVKKDIGGNFSLEEVAKGHHNQPSDYFDPRVGARYYYYNDTAGQQSFTAIDNIIRAEANGIKGRKITAYRAIPEKIKVNNLQEGDWITFSEKYARTHGENRFDGKYKLIKEEVNPKDVWWDGNDINEWGYDSNKLWEADVSAWNKAKASTTTQTTKIEAVNREKTQKLLKDSIDEWKKVVKEDNTNPFYKRPYTEAEIADLKKSGIGLLKGDEFKIKTAEDFADNFTITFHGGKGFTGKPEIRGASHGVGFWTTGDYKYAKNYGKDVKAYIYRDSKPFSKDDWSTGEYGFEQQFNPLRANEIKSYGEYRGVDYAPSLGNAGVGDFGTVSKSETLHFFPDDLIEIKLTPAQIKLAEQGKNPQLLKELYNQSIK